MLDEKELLLTLDDFRTIFYLPQANDNNHDRFVLPPSFSDMVPFYKNDLGFTMELKTSSSFKTTCLLQPWQTLCKIFSKCLTTRVTGWDQPPLQIMQMMYCFISNIHTITEEMKHTEHYRMYAEVFGIDVPLTQSRPSESTQGTYRTPSAPRSACLTPPAPVQTVDKADEMILQDTLQVSLAEHKSRQEQVARENVALVDEHLEYVEIEKMWKDKRMSLMMVQSLGIMYIIFSALKEEEITDEVYELKRMEKGKIVEEARFMLKKSFATLADHFLKAMVESLPTMVDKYVKEQVQKQVPEQVRDQVPEQGPSTSGNQVQVDEYDFWTESYASDDDEIPTKQVSQDIMKEVSLTIDEAKLKKIADERLRQRCTSGDEHQYHIHQMKNFLKSDIVWESRKEILVSPHPRKTIPLVLSCQRDPEAPALSLINQDLLYLKKGSSGPEKIVNKCVKKFNPYARYGVEHWKNPHAKIFYIRKQKELEKSKEVIYSNSKITQVIKTYWELGHEHKFITEIVARRSNECIVLITEPDFKNLNKNDIEDMYLLIMNGKKVNLTAPTISFPGIEKHKMFSIIYEPVHGIIYKNSKKEKKVMRHSEIHKFCDATLNRVLEALKSYNNDVKQMRRWEMYVNGRPLGPRRERPK
nr:hypothetical protein [Tanacetum cinerariifolium]